MLALEIVKYAYLATLVCVVMVELFPQRRIARPAALASIFLVSVGGSAWAYAAYHTPGAWPKFEYDEQAKASAAASDHGNGRRGGGGKGEAQDASAAGAADPGDADGGSDAGESAASGGAASAVAAAGNAAALSTQDAARALAVALGLASDPLPAPGAGDAVQDCSDCPQMVIVPPGRARIGAAEDDAMAKSAERPARHVRFWPGFAIGKTAVSDEDFRRFLYETRRAPSTCPDAVASLDTVTNVSDRLCLSPADAESFAVWLSNRSGKSYRLATAAEWEYAMRTLDEIVLQRGSRAEIVADCWQDRLPREGFDIYATQGRIAECATRMLKGAAAAEDGRWHRLSCRRPIGAQMSRALTSFRLVRDLAHGS